ncbi:unnamed protein product, partial [Mesorhabditis belari]|uniref:N-terminal acetyltransferase B complex subunit MDM20 homolog n=1 Tax=Mesorhabditis belari TaxID=2138241 RepID=A0AAF3FCV3_9BILA
MSRTKNAEQAVIERRLKPLYELIDSGNSKRAVQEAEKILKKHPDLICAKALKSLALLRLERNDEAFTIINDVEQLAKKQILDDGTLKALCHCFKEASTPGRIRLLYESQVELKPTEATLVHLFLAYVRLHEYKKQQQIATRLVKEFPSLNFSLWQVASVFMQGISDPIMGKKMFLPLAMKMLDSLMANHGLLFSIIELYELVCTELEDYEKLEKLIESPSYKETSGLSDDEFFMKLIDCYLKRGKIEEAFIRCFTFVLENEGDVNFSYWNLTYDCILQFLHTSSSAIQQETLENVCLILKELKQLKPSNQNIILAEIELFKRVRQSNNNDWKNWIVDEEAHFVEKLIRYILLFFIQPSCYNDVRLCLAVLSPKELATLLHFLASVDVWQILPQKFDENSQLWWGILLGQIFADYSDEKHVEKNVVFLNNVLEKLIEDEDELVKDEEAVTTIIQIIISMTYRLFTSTGDVRLFYDLIALLEALNGKFKELTLIKLALACLCKNALYSDRLRELVSDLEIKNVLRDTIGYLFHPVLDYTGQLKAAVKHHADTGTFYDQAERDTGDSLVLTYQSLKFEMLKGIVEMNHRFNQSLVVTAADVSNRWISAIFLLNENADVLQYFCGDKEEFIGWERLVDNRDMTISPFYQQASPPEPTKSFLEKKDFCQIRDEVMKAAEILGSPSRRAEKALPQLTLTKNLIERLRTVHKMSSEEDDYFSSTSSSHLTRFLHSPAFDLMIFVLQTLTDVSSVGGQDNKFEKSHFEKIIQDFVNTAETQAKSIVPQRVLYDYSLNLQALAFCKKVISLYYHGQSVKEKSSLETSLHEGLLKCQKVIEEQLTNYIQKFDLVNSQAEASTIWSQQAKEFIRATKSHVCEQLNAYYKGRFHQLKDHVF